MAAALFAATGCAGVKNLHNQRKLLEEVVRALKKTAEEIVAGEQPFLF